MTTDGEGNTAHEVHNAANIKVVRGSTLKKGHSKNSSHINTPAGELLSNIGAVDPNVIKSHRKTGSFGVFENNQKTHETDPD